MAGLKIYYIAIIYNCLCVVTDLTLELGEVVVLVVVTLGRALHKLEKVAQIFAFCGFEFGEFYGPEA